MTNEGPVKLGDVLKAIEHCAPGAVVFLKKHHYWVRIGTDLFRGLPKGPGRENLGADISFGHVRKMARMLKLDEACFRKYFGFE